MRCGFRIGLQAQVHCRATHRNAPSALAQGPAVGKFLTQQLASGRIIGPLRPQDCPGIITSSIAAIPKKTPGQWRVIVDLSGPARASVNDNLRREFTHVAYSSVEDAAMMLHSLGEGALLAKIDIQDAYRIIPIHPHDQLYLGLQWNQGIFMDTQLLFGLASAPAIFSALAEALE